MLGRKDTVRVNISGDEARCKELTPFAVKQAGLVKGDAEFQNLTNGFRKLRLDDLGSTITVIKVGNHYTVNVHVVPFAPVVEEPVVAEIVVEEELVYALFLIRYNFPSVGWWKCSSTPFDWTTHTLDTANEVNAYYDVKLAEFTLTWTGAAHNDGVDCYGILYTLFPDGAKVYKTGSVLKYLTGPEAGLASLAIFHAELQGNEAFVVGRDGFVNYYLLKYDASFNYVSKVSIVNTARMISVTGDYVIVFSYAVMYLFTKSLDAVTTIDMSAYTTYVTAAYIRGTKLYLNCYDNPGVRVVSVDIGTLAVTVEVISSTTITEGLVYSSTAPNGNSIWVDEIEENLIFTYIRSSGTSREGRYFHYKKIAGVWTYQYFTTYGSYCRLHEIAVTAV